MINALKDTYVLPVLLAFASSAVAAAQENWWLAVGGFLVSVGWLCVAISRESRNWLDRKS